MYSLGFSIGHDRGAVIIKDGKVLVGINDERLTRIKHDGGYSEDLPTRSINYCLNYLGISFKDIEQFVYTSTEYVPNVIQKFEELAGVPSYNLKFIPHHLAHAFSTFYSSGFDSATVIVADGMGSVLSGPEMVSWYPDVVSEFSTVSEGYAIYQFTLNTFREVYKKWTKYPADESRTDEEVSIGISYGIGSLQLVYNPVSNSWPAGKLMGLASYATKKYPEEVDKKLTLFENDLHIKGGRIFDDINHTSDFYSKANVAGIYQQIQETSCLHLVKLAKKLTDERNVCVAGGSFLNCNTNELIIKSGEFDNCYFIPGADDSGVALGCAWYAYLAHQRISSPPKTLSPYLGKTYSTDEILKALARFPDIKYKYYANFSTLVECVAEKLIENKVIGWFQDGSELGPRALGNRSIIASPKESWMREYINSDIKKREWYRPFAPSVVYEHQSDIFELDVFSPYMLVTTTVKDSWKDKIPAVTHIDGSARIQSVTEKSNPKYYRLIKEFQKLSDIPVILNTSFNGPSESIVETPLDAIKTFLNTNLSGLVINNFYIHR